MGSCQYQLPLFRICRPCDFCTSARLRRRFPLYSSITAHAMKRTCSRPLLLSMYLFRSHVCVADLASTTFLCVIVSVSCCVWCDQPTTCFGSDLSNNAGLTSISGTAFYGLSYLTSLDLSVSCCTSNLCLGAGALAPLSALNTLTLPSRWTCNAACPATTYEGHPVCESAAPTPSPTPIPTPTPTPGGGFPAYTGSQSGACVSVAHVCGGWYDDSACLWPAHQPPSPPPPSVVRRARVKLMVSWSHSQSPPPSHSAFLPADKECVSGRSVARLPEWRWRCCKTAFIRLLVGTILHYFCRAELDLRRSQPRARLACGLRPRC